MFQASALTFRHIKFDSIQDNINAMDQVRDFIDRFTFKGGGTCFVYNDWQYMFNETNKVSRVFNAFNCNNSHNKILRMIINFIGD